RANSVRVDCERAPESRRDYKRRDQVGRMHILTGTGLIVVLLSVAAWFYLPGWTSDATLYPLSAPFPASQGAHFDEPLKIDSTEKYCIELVFDTVRPDQIEVDRD